MQQVPYLFKLNFVTQMIKIMHKHRKICSIFLSGLVSLIFTEYTSVNRIATIPRVYVEETGTSHNAYAASFAAVWGAQCLMSQFDTTTTINFCESVEVRANVI